MPVQVLEDRTMLSGLVLEFTVDGDATLNGAGDVTAADIVRIREENFSSPDAEFELVFDGSDMGLDAGVDVDAFTFLDDGSLLLSFGGMVELDGVVYEAEDVVRFTPTSLGEETAGTFDMFLDGSTLGLGGPAGNVDAIAFRDGNLLISTAGNATLTGPVDPSAPTAPRETLDVGDGDLVLLDPDADGGFSDPEFSVFASKASLGFRFGSGNLDGADLGDDGGLFVSTKESFLTLGGASGSREDVVLFRSDGEESVATVFFDAGLADGQLRIRNLNGFDVRFLESTPNEPPTAADLSVELDEDGSATVQLLGDDGDAEPTGSTLTYEVVDGPENGTFTLDADTGELVCTPNADFNGSDRLVYRVVETTTDGQVLVSEVATVTFAVAAVNDAPVVTVGETVVGGEDARFALPGVSVSDVEGGDVRVVLRVRNGTLLVSGDAGTTRVRGNGTNRIVLRGSQADVNRLLAGLTYQGRLDFDGNDRLVVRVSDLGNSGSGGRLVSRATQDIVVQSPSDQAAALRDRIAALVDDGELRRGHGRVLASLVNFRSESRISEVRVRVFLRYVDLLERRGRLSSDTAGELRSAGTTLLTGLATSAAPRRFWFLFR